MGNLSAQKPSDTFDSLLHLSADTSGVTGSLQVVEDGLGVDTALKLDTNKVEIIPPSLNSTTAFQVSNVAGTPVLNVDTENKRIGIGTATPSHILDVSSSTDTYVEIATTTTDSETGVYFTDSGAVGRGKVIYDHDGDYMAFDVLSAERMRITTSPGRVGIGTTAPASSLDVSSTQSTVTIGCFETTTAAKQAILQFQRSEHDTIGTLAVTQSDNDLGFIDFKGVNTSSASTSACSILGRQAGSAGATYLGGEIAFYTGENDGAQAQRMCIIDDGSVGIGTACPQSKLNVAQAGYSHATNRGLMLSVSPSGAGDDVYGGSIIFGELDSVTAAGQGAAIASVQTGGDNQYVGLAFMTHDTDGTAARTEAMRIEHDGKIGIGTTEPAAQLHLSDSIQAEILLTDTGGGEDKKQVSMRVKSDHFSIIAEDDDNSLKRRLLQMALDNGDIVIGAEDNLPSGYGYARLTIHGAPGSADGPHVQFTLTDSDYPVFQQFFYTHDNAALSFDAYFDDAWKSSDPTSNFQILKQADKLQFRYDSGIAQGGAVTWNDGIVLETDGHVGIGTACPSAKLEVVGSFAANGTNSTFVTFGDGDPTPSVAAGNIFKHHASPQTINMFDDGVCGQIITVISTAAITYDFDESNLKCGSADIVTANGDVTVWVFDGTNWYLISWMDVGEDLSATGGF